MLVGMMHCDITSNNKNLKGKKLNIMVTVRGDI